ncbi:MAG: alpha/beta hydrolase family protein [Polyangiaceae bacterium]
MTTDRSPSLVHRALMDAAERRHRFAGGDVRAWQRELRARLRELTGYERMPQEPPALDVQRLWLRDGVEKLTFCAEEHASVPAYLMLPEGTPPFATMLCLQGHSTGMHNSVALDAESESHAIEVEGARDFARQCVAQGYAALCIEQRAFGERRELQQAHVNRYNPCHDAAMHALALGRTLLAERVYDVARALDFVSTRAELDDTRVGVMGNSGGGTVAIWAGALLERIAFVMPSCSLCTFRHSLMSVYHCSDNYIPGILQVAEMADVAGLIAPRPLLAVTGAKDALFPLEGVRQCFDELHAVYRALGAATRAELIVGSEGHRFYPELAWPRALELFPP